MTLLCFTPALLIAALSGLWMCTPASAQSGGDQLIDGIGETSLIARYPLDGDANDRSRDGNNARVVGGEFVDDRRFQRALSLPGRADTAIELPSSALKGVGTVSVVGWVRLRATQGEADWIDLGAAAGRLHCTLVTGATTAGVRAIAPDGLTTTAPPIVADRWTHLAVVYDAAGHSLALYVNGEPSARAEGRAATRPATITNDEPSTSVIGRHFNGLLRDVRLYSVALTGPQIATIYRNAGGRARPGQPRSGPATRDASPVAVDFGATLLDVPDVAVTTAVGQLPTLPAMVDGLYAANAAGPKLRVIWPSPTSNAEAARVRRYTVKGRVPGTPFEPRATVTVMSVDSQPPARRQLVAFPLGEVTLDRDAAGRDSLFVQHRDRFVDGLCRTNPDDFLYMFRDAFGQTQPPNARPLGVWDGQTTRLRGHATGHYLSALAQAYAGSGYDRKQQADLLGKMNYTIDVLYDLSQKSGRPKEPGGPSNEDPAQVPPGAGRTAYDSDLSAGHIRTDFWNWGRGYIGAYPPDQFILLEHGATYGTGNDQIWAPYYTLHKILAGLLDCYEVGGNPQALEVARGMGLWTYARLKVLPAETRAAMWNRYIAGEYGGMNEVLARLGRVTGDARFIKAAKLFDNNDFFFGTAAHPGGLAADVDTLRGKHANQHIPQVIGALETFADTGDAAYFRVAENFWTIATTSYAYSVGGVAGGLNPNNAECFTAEPNTLWQNGFSDGGQNETCATYNLLKLGRGLFAFRPGDGRYMDYYERALFNDILASVDEHDAGNTYHIPLNPGSKKSFGNADMRGFTCCNGTALESNTKLQDTIYLRSADGTAVYVNLFVPSTLKWAERDLSITQQTRFPYADTTRLTLHGVRGVDLLVRVPDWSAGGSFVKVNGVDRSVSARPGTYVNLGRGWNDGDTVEIRMPFAFHFARVMDRPNIASLLYGPIVLAADESGPRTDWRRLPVDVANPAKSIDGDPSTLRFNVGDVTLRPFFEAYGRYSVYFDLGTTP